MWNKLGNFMCKHNAEHNGDYKYTFKKRIEDLNSNTKTNQKPINDRSTIVENKGQLQRSNILGSEHLAMLMRP